jgi:general secretion pathway protein G
VVGVWHRTRRQGGITLVELAIAALILGVLAAVAIPQYVGYQKRLETKRAIVQIQQLEQTIERYRTDFGGLPATLVVAIDPVPLDPWGNPYEYLDLAGAPPGKARKDKNLVPINSDYDLYSRGPDGNSVAPLTAAKSHDDVIRANDGAFVGVAKDY